METHMPQNGFVLELNRLAETYHLHQYAHGIEESREDCFEAAACIMEARLRETIEQNAFRLKKSRHRSPRYTVLSDQKAAVTDAMLLHELYDFVQLSGRIDEGLARMRPTGLRVVGGTDIHNDQERI